MVQLKMLLIERWKLDVSTYLRACTKLFIIYLLPHGCSKKFSVTLGFLLVSPYMNTDTDLYGSNIWSPCHLNSDIP